VNKQDDPRRLTDALGELAQSRANLPPYLEQRVLADLRQQGVVRSATRPRRWVQAALIGVAATLIFVAGLGAGRVTKREPQPRYNYLLLLEEGPEYHAAQSTSESQQRVREYSQWAAQLRAEGISVLGMKLNPQAVPIASSRPLQPASPAGLFAVTARDLDSAKRIAEQCPHLKYGGGVILRPISPT